MDVSALSNQSDTLSLSYTSSNGYVLFSRALMMKNNVIVDVAAAGPKEGPPKAASVAQQVAAKVPNQ
jgi:PknH-like extracellular domain